MSGEMAAPAADSFSDMATPPASAPLIAKARDLGYHSVVAVVGASQTASLGLHHKFGFQDAGYLKEVGFKFGQWVDVVDLQLRL